MIRGLVKVTPNHLNEPVTANTPAIVILQGHPGERRYISQIEWSYSSSPNANGSLTVEDGIGNIVKRLSIINGGPDELQFISPLAGTKGASWKITLSAGGNGRLGKVSVSEFFPQEDHG
jgi:hypothetical protein